MKIVFFGVVAVCSVMSTLLDELSNKSKQKDINFVFVVRNIKKAQAHFFKNSNVLNKSDFLEIKHFEEIFEDSKKYENYLGDNNIIYSKEDFEGNSRGKNNQFAYIFLSYIIWL